MKKKICDQREIEISPVLKGIVCDILPKSEDNV